MTESVRTDTSFTFLVHATLPQFIKIPLITVLSANVDCVTVPATFFFFFCIFKYTIFVFSSLQAVF